MILEALRVLLFGMLGIFVVMAIIFGVIVALSKISGRFGKPELPEAGEANADIEPTTADQIAVTDHANSGEVSSYQIEAEEPLEYADQIEYDGLDGVEYIEYLEYPEYVEYVGDGEYQVEAAQPVEVGQPVEAELAEAYSPAVMVEVKEN